MKYIKSAVFPKDYPPADAFEVAIAGRSNAGKSTFINGIAGSKIAHVSQTPGKTRLLSFFDFKGHYRFVDMPGYGFASRSGDEIREWTHMIETYLSMRGNLKGLVLVMDIRRKWDEDEEILKKFCNKINIPMIIVASKADKCNQSELSKYRTQLKKDSQMSDIFPISGLTKKGIAQVEQHIFDEWIKPEKNAPKGHSHDSDDEGSDQ